MINIPIEELVKLKEQGMTDAKIAEYFTQRGQKISVSAINMKFKKYYKSRNEVKPRGRKEKIISDEELVRLKEQGMTDSKISEYFEKQGIKIPVSQVCTRLVAYYASMGEKKPRGRNIGDEELVKMKEQRKSDREIAEYFTKQGRKISLTSVNIRLNKHYKSRNTIKPRAIWTDIIKKEITNEEIMKLREQGMTLKEISEHFAKSGKKISQTAIGTRIKRVLELQEISNNEQEEIQSNQQNDFRNRIKVATVPIITKDRKKSVEKVSELGEER